MRLLSAILVLSLTGLNAHAGLVKWVDADGRVHYSDSLPPEVSKAQTVRSVTGKGQEDAPASFSPKTVAEREAEMKKARSEKEEAAQQKSQQEAVTQAKKRACESARENLRVLEGGTRITTVNASGERVFLDDDERSERLEEARKAASDNCD